MTVILCDRLCVTVQMREREKKEGRDHQAIHNHVTPYLPRLLQRPIEGTAIGLSTTISYWGASNGYTWIYANLPAVESIERSLPRPADSPDGRGRGGGA